MKKVLFFDIDGTLLNSELKIPEGVKRELKRLKEAGHYLFVASGRPLAFISNQIIDAGFNGFVLCNGAHVELNHEIIYENRKSYSAAIPFADKSGRKCGLCQPSARSQCVSRTGVGASKQNHSEWNSR